MAEYDGLGNETAKPKAAKSDNPISELIDSLNLDELTFETSSYWSNSQIKPYNPDDLVRKRFDYSVYEEMVQDDQVSVCLQLKKDLVLASGFQITSEDSSSENKEIREALDVCLNEHADIPLIENLEEILTAYEFGFSLSEKIFKIKDDGYAALKCIKTRHPVTWLIHTDDHGNIERYEQRGPSGSIDVPAESLIHYVNNRKFQNAYGTSDLRAAYLAWFVKTQIIKFYGIFLEKAASPLPVAKYDKNVPQQAVDDIYNAIKKLQTKTALVVPKEIEMEFLEAKNTGEAFVKGINIFNMFIGRSLMIPDLLGFQGSETSGGSFSLGKEQMNVFFKHLERRRTILENIVNKEIIRPLVQYNWGEVENYPKFKLNPMRDEELIELCKLWLEAVKGKVYQPSDEEINHFRRLAKFPEGEIIRVTEPEVDPETGDPIESGSPEGKTQPENKSKDSPEEKGSDASEAPKKQFKKDDTPGSYSKKVDFKVIKGSMDQFKSKIMVEARPVIAEIFKDLGEQLATKRIIETQKLEKIDMIKLKFTSKLRMIIKKAFLQAHKDAKNQAVSELFKGNYKAPLPNKKFLDFLDEETFQYIGDWEYNIKKATRLKLVEAIKDGKPLSEVTGILDDEGIPLAEESLERYSRTKITEVMNRGRLESFEESGVVAAYQYSAILDDRTSDICEGLHGLIFQAGTEPIPPMHFNCRSLLIPITKYEEFEADKSVDGMSIDKFIDKNKGEGFSKQ